MTTVFSGCDVQIFEHEEELAFKECAEDEMEYDKFYVKNGTAFGPVYTLENNYEGMRGKTPARMSKSKFVWFRKDEFMLPTHYKGEIIGYKSLSAGLSSVTLERYEDIGYTFGVYGGTVQEDGYYHFNSSDKNTLIPGSYAAALFARVPSSEIRITSIDGNPVSDYVDKYNGLFVGLEKNQECIIEFYGGTQKYTQYFYADMHVMREFEFFVYDSKYITDTTRGYRAFHTPQDLKSGYYSINDSGLFKYVAYEKGSVPDELDMNEKYYLSEGDMIRSYSQQYTLSVPQAVRDLSVTISYDGVLDETDDSVEPGCYIESPAGEVYEMSVDEKRKVMTFSIKVAQAGDWTLNVIPKSLEIGNIYTDSLATYEEATLLEKTFTIEDGENAYREFRADIEGSVDTQVYGSIIASDGSTYNLKEDSYLNSFKEKKRFLYYDFPYIKTGQYIVRVYYYASTNQVDDIVLSTYGEQEEEDFVFGDNTEEEPVEIEDSDSEDEIIVIE